MPEDPYAAFQAPDPYKAFQAPTGEQNNQPLSVGGFLGNAVDSGVNLLGNTVNAAIHPLNTIGNVAKLGLGAMEKGVRPVVSAIKGENIQKTPEEQQLDSVLDFYRQRYGGLSNVGHTLYTDPFGAAMDASAVLGGGGALLKGAAGVADAANAGRVASGLRTGAQAANKAAVAVNPVLQGTKLATQVVPAIPGAIKSGAQAAYNYMVPFDPHKALVQAIKPRALRLNFADALETAAPDIKAAETTPINGVEDALKTIEQAKAQNRAAYDQFRGPANQMGTQVDLTPMADHMDATIPESLQHQAAQGDANSVAAIRNLRSVADTYRTTVPLEKAEKFLKEANADLDSFYAKYPRQQWSALQTNPESAATYVKAQELRNAIYNALDSPNLGAGARELQKRYGNLLEVEQELQRRQNVAARQQPVSLAQQISKGRAAGKLIKGVAMAPFTKGMSTLHALSDVAEGLGTNAIADYLKEQQMTDNLIKRAFAEYPNQAAPFPQPTPVNIRGQLGPGAIQMPGVPDPSGPVPNAPGPNIQYNPNAKIGAGLRGLPAPTIKLPGQGPGLGPSGPVQGAPAPAQPFRVGFPKGAPAQLGPGNPPIRVRGTPPSPPSTSARAMPGIGESLPVQMIFTEPELRQIAARAGKNPDAAVAWARQNGMLNEGGPVIGSPEPIR